jgi:2-polyprenyl-3-methyl-5-hydroxy-6-metoxy-1,4-benzoquinol methylase
VTVETHLDYVGDELEIFALALRWKAYFASSLAPYINGAVAEVGAGLGAITRALCNPAASADWLCIEPDEKMAAQLRQSHASGRLPARCGVHCGILADLPVERKFTTIIYIDVLEHIEDDQRELNDAASHPPGGNSLLSGQCRLFGLTCKQNDAQTKQWSGSTFPTHCFLCVCVALRPSRR